VSLAEVEQETQERRSHLASHFEDLEQQHATAVLGMWAFLATEVMFFGGLFMAFIVYRFVDPRGFALASRQLDIALGTFNTFVLLTSSLTMALAVRSGQTGDRKGQVLFLVATMVLATTFLGIKASEYYEEYEKMLVPGPIFSAAALKLPGDAPPSLAQQAELFFVFYFFMTGLHAFHMIIGVVIMGILAVQARRGRFTPEYFTPLELTGLYWHFVDLVWVFLFPLLYLIDLHK
jgi:cytochrome c oxidase subunit 3